MEAKGEDSRHVHVTDSPPSVRTRELDHRLKTETFEQENRWTSCCFDVDRRACVFITKVTVSMSVMVFCMTQIYRDSNGCANSLLSWYTGTIGTIMGSLAQERYSSKSLEQQSARQQSRAKLRE